MPRSGLTGTTVTTPAAYSTGHKDRNDLGTVVCHSAECVLSAQAFADRGDDAVNAQARPAPPQRPPDGSGRIKNRALARVAWSLWLIMWPLVVLGLVLEAKTKATGGTLASVASFALVVGLYATVGAVIATREPRNAIGWLCLTVGLLGGLEGFAIPYAGYALVDRPGSLPGGLAMAWLSLWLSFVWLLTITFVPLLFPTGRLPSPRWRPVARASAATLAAVMVTEAVTPGPMRSTPGLPPNPLGIEGAAAALERIDTIVLLLLGLTAAACVGSVVARFRRARGVERQQLKWFTYAVGLFALLFGTFTLITTVWDWWVSQGLSDVLFGTGYAMIPVATGIAILRYRLYDIDLLINRTLVYGLLTAVLAAGYAGMVLVLGQLFGGVTSNPPSWVIAGATLAVAAVFQPARRRIQNVVDRRFNRHRYDAARTVEAFSVRLRDHIDLDTLTYELLAVIDHTMEPTATSLWLRGPVDQPDRQHLPQHRQPE
jgi:hypothetical protein